MAGITVARSGVSSEKKSVASQNICGGECQLQVPMQHEAARHHLVTVTVMVMVVTVTVMLTVTVTITWW